MAQQTAVEWLECQLKKIPFVNVIDVFQQAKQMEKEQIGNAWVDGYKNHKEVLKHSRLEQYYNETYGIK